MKSIFRKQSTILRHKLFRKSRYHWLIFSLLIAIFFTGSLVFHGFQLERAWGISEPSINTQDFGTQLSQKERQELDIKVDGIKKAIEGLDASITNRQGVYSRIHIAQKFIEIVETLVSRNISAEILPTSLWEDIRKILKESVEWSSKPPDAQSHSDVQSQPDTQVKSWAMGYLGHFYEAQTSLPTSDRGGTLEEARRLTKKALNIAQSTMQRAIEYRWKWQLGRIYNAESNHEKAIEFYDLAYQDIQVLRQEILPAPRKDQFDFRDRVEPLYREYASLLLKQPNWDQKQIFGRDIRQIVSSLQLSQLENFLDCTLQLDNNIYADIDSVIEHDSSVALLYPIILPDRLEVLLKLPGETLLKRKTQMIRAEQVEATLKDLRLNLEKPYFSSRHGVPAAIEVYKWLIQPFEEEQSLTPEKIETLVFVLDGDLRNVPMAALCVEKKGDRCGQYLIEKYAIALSPSLEIPKKMPSLPRRAFIAGLNGQPLDRNFGVLQYVPEEVNRVKYFFRNLSSTIPKQLTKDVLYEVKGSYDVVHLATHSEFGDTQGDTFVLTSNGRVKLSKFPDLFRSSNNPINLLVLSSCETATGNNREVLGIAGASIQAGARSTLATLWSIQGSVTADLMNQFYSQWLEEGVSKAEALRRAQRKLLKIPAYKPSHWAPYVLVGDWR